MLARLFRLCGVSFGPESELLRSAPDNQEGYWENVHFVNLNDEILSMLHGSWERPPLVAEGWEELPQLEPLKDKARELLRPFQAAQQWAWKDPRNSLTFPFWDSLLQDMKVVICLRNPLEVARSLQKRHPFAEFRAHQLWLAYYRSLLSRLDADKRIVTHYNSFFLDAKSELLRVVRLLNIPVAKDDVDRIAQNASPNLRHHQVNVSDLLNAPIPKDVLKCYMDLCAEAGPVFQQALGQEPQVQIRPVVFMQSLESSYRDALMAAKLESRLACLADENHQRDQVIQNLQAQAAERDRALHTSGMKLAENSQALQELTGRLKETGERVQDLTTQLGGKDLTVATLTTQLAECNQVVMALTAASVEKDQAVLALRAQTVAKEQAAEEMARQLLHNDNALQTLNAQLQEKNDMIRSMVAQSNVSQQIIQQLHAHLRDLTQTCQGLAAQTAELEASAALSLVRGFRRCRLLLAPTGSFRHRLVHTIVTGFISGLSIARKTARWLTLPILDCPIPSNNTTPVNAQSVAVDSANRSQAA
jgi:hypothetical protein